MTSFSAVRRAAGAHHDADRTLMWLEAMLRRPA